MRCLFFLIALSLPFLADAQVFYHCSQGGRKLVSDRPCEEQGAKETKRVNAEDMTPLSTADGLSKEERRKGDAVSNRLERESQKRQAERDRSRAFDAQAREQNRGRCNNLYKEKESIVNQQRSMSNDWLNERHRKVNDEIYRLKCGS